LPHMHALPAGAVPPEGLMTRVTRVLHAALRKWQVLVLKTAPGAPSSQTPRASLTARAGGA
jgi:hypothetical protein